MIYIDLRRYSTLFPLLARWFTLPEVGAGGSAEAAARFKQACLSIGLKRLQWCLVAERSAPLHEICAWVADKVVCGISRVQRAQGWAYLLRRARLHADERRRRLALASIRWAVPLHPISVGELTAVPLTCGIELWEESVAMRHCADLYGGRCAAGMTLVLSVRTADGGRKATLAIECRRGDWVLSHAVGPSNRQIGKEFDELIDATLSLLNAVDSSRRRSPKGPRYRIDVLDNFGHGESWSENTFRSAEAALGAARRICRSGLPSRDEAGQEAWLFFGETPIIMELDGADPLEFDALDYINGLCRLKLKGVRLQRWYVA